MSSVRHSSYPSGKATVSAEGYTHGEVAVTYLPTIFKKIKLHTHENVGWGRIHLDEDTFHTTSYWLQLPSGMGSQLRHADLECGLIGLAHVLGEVAPLFL